MIPKEHHQFLHPCRFQSLRSFYPRFFYYILHSHLFVFSFRHFIIVVGLHLKRSDTHAARYSSFYLLHTNTRVHKCTTFFHTSKTIHLSLSLSLSPPSSSLDLSFFLFSYAYCSNNVSVTTLPNS